jgi:hypothetical protein
MFSMFSLEPLEQRKLLSVSITLAPSVAPNGTGSPSFPAYGANAIMALGNGLTTIGNPTTDPTAYQVLVRSTVAPEYIVVTPGPSWHGVVNPTGAFSEERGNRMHFGAHIVSTETLTLSQVTYVINSNDPANALGTTFSFAGQSHNIYRQGINYGADGVKGGFDDVTITSGSGNQAVHELNLVGTGVAFQPTSDPDLTDQEEINEVMDWVREVSLTQVTCTLSVSGLNRSTITALKTVNIGRTKFMSPTVILSTFSLTKIDHSQVIDALDDLD